MKSSQTRKGIFGQTKSMTKFLQIWSSLLNVFFFCNPWTQFRDTNTEEMKKLALGSHQQQKEKCNGISHL